MQIRPITKSDEMALSEICLRTADLGDDGTALFSDPRLPGLVWAVPYLHGPTALGFVLEERGIVLGYIVGALDTGRFEAWQVESWWPEARRRLAGFEPETPDDREALAEMTGEELPQFARDYPAHFHIDFLPEARGQGYGRTLIGLFCDEARKAGVEGVHLGVAGDNTNAVGFYRHLGFADIASDNIDPTGLILGKRLK